MRFGRLDYTVWAVAGLLLLALGAVLARGDRVGVGFVGIYPEEGALVAGRAPIVLEFAQAMEADTVENRFSIQPAVAGIFEWHANTLYFLPQAAFELGQTYEVRLGAGVATQLGHRLEEDMAWTFGVRAPGIAYLAEHENGRELWILPELGGQPRQLTDSGGRVFDFAVAPNGEHIAYSLINEENGIDIHAVPREGGEARLLVRCGADRCSAPDWSPSGAQLAFARAPAGLAPGEPHGPPRIWVLDLATNESVRLHADTQKIGYGPSWSPTGERLAYVDGVNSQIVVVEMDSGVEISLPSTVGVVGTWSPDGNQLVYFDTDVVDGQAVNLVYRADLAARDILPLVDPQPSDVNYSNPAWSPDGEWLAVRVRLVEAEAPGDQLWVLRADATSGRVVDEETDTLHLNHSWDPWGSALLYQRIPLGEARPVAQAWVWRADTGEAELVASGMTAPQWLP